jgi:F-type H+-transporting ATPase subunit c
MKKAVCGGGFAALLLFAPSVFAAEAGNELVMASGLWVFITIAIGCGFGIGIAAYGTGMGMGNAINGALQGTARNPEASGKIMTTMIIGLALIESLCIYALVICFILVFKIPDLSKLFEAILKSLGA